MRTRTRTLYLIGNTDCSLPGPRVGDFSLLYSAFLNLLGEGERVGGAFYTPSPEYFYSLDVENINYISKTKPMK